MGTTTMGSGRGGHMLMIVLALGAGCGGGGGGNPTGSSTLPDASCGLFTPASLAADCTFPLPPAASAPLGGLFRVSVYANATLVPWDVAHIDGWDAIDATDTVGRIYGPTCDEVADGGVVDLTTDYRCDPLN